MATPRARYRRTFWSVALLFCIFPPPATALDPRKSLTQYSRLTWTQQDGLPQDTIRAIAQTTDGYLWVGTDEGLARFDGYEFVVFDKTKGDLPGNSITALASSGDGALWIGTSNGLTEYRNKQFHTYTTKQGLPDNAITSLYEDHGGVLWIVAGVYLSRFQGGKFTNFAPDADLPVTSVRQIREDEHHDLWVAGFSRIVKMAGTQFTTVIDPKELNGDIVSSMVAGRDGRFWIGGTEGVIRRTPTGEIHRYGVRDGLPDKLVRALWMDRDGNLWAGTNLGLARLDGNHFVTPEDQMNRSIVRCLFEDREGNLWVGSNDGLTRYRDDILTVYGKSEGLPSDEPNAVYQDHQGRMWVGFHDSGLMLFSGAARSVFTTREGLPNNEVFSIRETRDGDLLIGARGGLVRMHGGHFTTLIPPDPLGRINVFDAMEDSTGRIWLATPGGLDELQGTKISTVVPSQPLLVSSMVRLCQGRNGEVWAGTYGKGLWRIRGSDFHQFTTADGLSSDEIRSLYLDPDGTLWIGTFGGGLNALRDGKFEGFTSKDGLLSDNVSDVTDDGESLWLSTTRGICRISKRQLRDFTAHRRARLEPVNYGVEDGLRSASCSPSFPIGSGGYRTMDGKIWFTTSRGLAVFDPAGRTEPLLAPAAQVMEIAVDGHPVDMAHTTKLGPNIELMQIRYAGIYLRAPERVRYSVKLDGLDTEWRQAGSRRVKDYNSLPHGHYTFHVKAEVAGAPSSEQSYAFEMLPRFYETAWFRLLAAMVLVAMAWGVYQLRLRQIRSRFALVLEERARLAREIHDTLAQGFVGISSQLDAVAMCMPDQTSPARTFLDLARRMARHSLTEARRSVMDLRASALEGQNLAAALQSGTRVWTLGSGVDVDVHVDGDPGTLPGEMEQHLLRIAQEAVTNVLKHAGASKIWIKLNTEARKLYLRIRDNGQGFEQDGVFSSRGGHFGLIGMRERAERLGGELNLVSHRGEGTEVEVKVPLP
ncbi:MAG TPA: two-component regulator propeller domain-containing protein [Bryobacteraceae bacterium]|nr:two-component regulator propeller domain-containing protein [Bryobacteraceae bacterium]